MYRALGLFLFVACLFILVLTKKTRIRYANLTAQNVNCSKEDFRALANDLSLATDQVLLCLQKYDRHDDAANLKKLLIEKPVNMQCVDNQMSYLAMAHTGPDPLTPGMSVQVNKFRKDVTLLRNSFMQTLAHESIHWLGYYHYADVDWSYIAQYCCLPSEKVYAGAQERACKLFRYQNKSDFFAPSYLRDFNSLMIFVDHFDIGFATILKSASKAAPVFEQRTLSADRVDRILDAPIAAYIEDLNSHKDGNEFSYKLKSELVYTMILTRILRHSNFEDIALLNQRRQDAVMARFFGLTQYFDERDSLNLIGDFLEPIIRDQGLLVNYRLKELIQKNKAICDSLDVHEVYIVNSILRSIMYLAVDKISEGEDKTYFSLDAPPTKSERSNLLKTLEQFCKLRPVTH